MHLIHIPELDDFLEAASANPRGPDRLIVSGNWRDPVAAIGILNSLGRRYPEIQRISGGQLQTIARKDPGERFAGSCWRSPPAQVELNERRVLCAVIGVYFHGRIAPPRLRELQLKLKLICPTQPQLIVRPFQISIPDLMATEPTISRWVATRLYSTGTTFYEKINGQSSHWGTSAAV
ncbi:MAG: hypothetical protein RIF32_24290 [Leptospirales bacterium]|jgi:hypothetical protein